MKNSLDQNQIDLYRSQTDGCKNVIHFNNAGSSLPPAVVVDTVIDYLREEAIAGGYETEAKYSKELDAVYGSLAKFLNADTDEVAVFENASAAWGTAFRGLDFEDGDEIITTEMEYVSNLIGIVDAKDAKDIKVVVLPNDSEGNFSIAEMEKAINAKTKLIAVTHVSSSGGSILPIELIGQLAQKNKILYLVDACQSAGQMPLDVKKIGCDMLSATGRKYLRAPRGTGFLFVRKAIQDRLKPVQLDFFGAGNVSLNGYTLRNDARRFELYEKSRALTLGLGKALDYASGVGLDKIWNRINGLAEIFRTKLNELDGITVRDFGNDLSGIVTFSVAGVDSFEVKAKLAESNINVSVGGAQATPIYMQKNGLSTVVRASIHYYNTEAEINRFIEVLSRIKYNDAFL